MQDLPDDELFRKIKLRLEDYQEQPDDDLWNLVSQAISTPEPSWIRLTERASLVVMIFAGIFMLKPLNESQSSLNKSQSVRADTSSLSTSARSFADNIDTHRAGSTTGFLPETDTGAEGRVHQRVIAITRATNNPAENFVSEQTNRDEFSLSPSLPGFLTINAQTQTDSAQVSSGDLNDSVALTINQVKQNPAKTEVIIKPTRHKQKGVRAYALFTPSLTFHQIQPSKADDVILTGLNSPGIFARERLSHSIESGIQFRIANRLTAYAGISYYQQATHLSFNQYSEGSQGLPGSNSSEYTFAPKTETRNVQYSLRNIGTMAGLMYGVSAGKISQHIGTGLQYEYGMLKRSDEMSHAASHQYVNYRIFYRAEYSVNDRLTLFVQPTFSGSLMNDNVRDGMLTVRQTRAGIGFGILFQF